MHGLFVMRASNFIGGWNSFREQYHLILIRFFTGVVLFVLLGKANIWFDTTTNSVLALTYRSMVLLLPAMIILCGRYTLLLSLIFMISGLALFVASKSIAVSVLAALLFSHGAAIGGYLLKNIAAQTKTGSAYNRVSMNAGSFAAGLILMIGFLIPFYFFIAAILALLLCLWLARKHSIDPRLIRSQILISYKVDDILPWITIGIAMGILIFGVFSVLPQAILRSGQELPIWYGAMIILNSLIIMVMQVPVMGMIEKYNMPKGFIIISIMVFGFIILSIPELFYVKTLIGAIIWISLISLVECTFSHIDYYAIRAKAMFVKELSIGLGSGLTVLTMRAIEPPLNSLIISFIGGGCAMIWYFMTRKKCI